MNEENLTHLNRTTSLKKVIANNERVELNLPFKGSNSANLLRKKLVEIVRKSYPTVKTSVIFFHQSQPFPIKNRDLQKASNIIYKFTCGCGSSYVGKTTQRLKTRIRQHVPVALRRNLGKTTRSKLTEKQQSAVGKHLLDNPGCGRNFHDGMFSVLAEGRGDLHLSVLESLFISTQKPDFCTKSEQGRSVLWNS